MNPYYNNYGGYPIGYPPQPYGYDNSMATMNNPTMEMMESPYSPFMNPPIPRVPNLPESQLENVYVDANGVVHGATEGPIQYTSVSKHLAMGNIQPVNPYSQPEVPVNPYYGTPNANVGYVDPNQPSIEVMNTYGAQSSGYANPYQNVPPAPMNQNPSGMDQNNGCANPYLQYMQNNNQQPQVQPVATPYQQPVNPGYQQYPSQQPVAPQPQNDAGYNPFSQYNIQPQQPMMQPNGYPQQNPYTNAYNVGGYNYGCYNYQYGFDYQYSVMLAAEEYGHNIPGFDPFECLRDVVLSDNEKALSVMHTPTGYYNNGQPIFTREQQMEYNKVYEESREKVINFWTQLSIAAHRGTGETDIDEDTIRAHYDPSMWKYKPSVLNKPVMECTEDELEIRSAYTRVDHTQIIANMFNRMDGYYNYIDQKRAEGYARIKASHDKILGLKPEEMNLKNYLCNAGSLYVDAISRESRRLAHDGSIKYARSSYKNMLAKPGAGPLDPAFTDDDYVPLEKRLKEKYIMSKVNFKTIQLDENGDIVVKAPPKRSENSDDANRAAFLKDALGGYVHGD